MDPGAVGAGEQYTSLFGEPTPASIRQVSSVTGKKAAELSQVFSLASVPSATQAQIHTALAGVARADWLAAFDVGQGACNALMSAEGFPVVYFDFGGGVLANQWTYPSTLNRLCLTQRPPIVLSHWDWDHWCSVGKSPEALGMTWLVPDQAINRPVHLQFAADVHDKGTLLIWSPGTPSPTVGRLRLELCTGTSRNDSGIAMTFDCGNRERALITGDARYSAVPASLKVSLAVPHHGAKCALTTMPKPVGLPARAAFSFGTGNTHGHATPQCRAAHTAAGWHRQVDTADCALGPRAGVVIAGRPQGYVHRFPCQSTRCDLTVRKS